MSKLKIYYLLSSEAELKPLSGDRINEINLIKALTRDFDVYYNGEKCSREDRVFGRSDGIIVTPRKGEYDLVYVRNNKEVFLDAPSPKLWFASPYITECFDVADGIVCMTSSWKERLMRYSGDDFDYFVEMYPRDMAAPENCLLFPQVVELPSQHAIEQLKTDKSGKPGKFGFLPGIFSIKRKTRLDLKHFGPVRPSNFPHQLSYYLAKDAEIRKRLTATCVGPGNKLEIPKPINKIARVEPEVAFSMLINSDAIWYNQDESGNVAGSLKILEAMAAGVPIIAPRYDARAAELGDDYPYFWRVDPGTSIRNGKQSDFQIKLLQMTESLQDEKKTLSEYLRGRAYAHSYENVSEILASEIDIFITNYQ